MQPEMNLLGQPVGQLVPNWALPELPARITMKGQFCRIEPLDPERHARELFQANEADQEGRSWTYLPYGPFANFEEYHAWLIQSATTTDPLFFAILDLKTNKAAGVCSYLRIDPRHGSIEVGHLNFSPSLQATPAATEAMYLMMERAFNLGYRRYEWKCHALNTPSRRAAQRLGFSFEGIFRQAAVYKGRNRDTAWFSIIDKEWPALKRVFQHWLAQENFDDEGRQKSSLSEMTSQLRPDSLNA
jgi:RimJ/RimL family protein N-acetyltransferase